MNEDLWNESSIADAYVIISDILLRRFCIKA